MVKTITIFSLRPEYDREASFKAWGEDHMPWIRELPGLEKYVINWVKEPIRGDKDLYGLVELWWKDMNTARNTMQRLFHTAPDEFAKRLYHVSCAIFEENEVEIPKKKKTVLSF